MRDIANLKENSNDVDRIFHVLGKCIDEIHFGDDVYRKSDMTENDINDFIDQLSSLQFEKLSEFFNGMPKLRHVIQVTNPKTKKKSEVVLEGLEFFFRVTLSHDSLFNYYETNFALMQHHKYSLTELDNMIPWEREIYVNLLAKWIKEENERIKEEERKSKQ